MTDIEWITGELAKYQEDEIKALANLKTAHEELTQAKAEYAKAKETLEGIRGGIGEFIYQLDYVKAYGKRP